PDSLEEEVAGVQQLTEISLSHKQGRDGGGALLILPVTDELLTHEEEELVPAGIKRSRNEHRAADGIPRLIEAKRRGLTRLAEDRAVVSGPGVGVESRVPKELPHRPVELPGSTLGHEAHLAVFRPAVLGGHGRCQNLNFLDRVYVDLADHRLTV